MNSRDTFRLLADQRCCRRSRSLSLFSASSFFLLLVRGIIFSSTLLGDIFCYLVGQLTTSSQKNNFSKIRVFSPLIKIHGIAECGFSFAPGCHLFFGVTLISGLERAVFRLKSVSTRSLSAGSNVYWLTFYPTGI